MPSQEKRIRIFGLSDENRLENLRGKVDIERLLVDLGFENLARSGPEVWARCRFHDDNGRHWSINVDETSPRWGFHSCFVCVSAGESAGRGRLVALVRDVLSLGSFRAALDWLESWAGIAAEGDAALDLAVAARLPRGRALPEGEGDRAPEAPADVYGRFRPLQPGSPGWHYLTARRVTPEQIVSRGGREGLGKFRGRAVFPILRDGAVVAFLARAWDGTEPKMKYSEGKGTIAGSLFGLDKVNPLKPVLYAGEGIFDVLSIERSLTRAGYPNPRNAVAVGGPVVHPGQVRFFRPFDTVVLVPDNKGKAESIVPSARKLLGSKVKLLIAQPPRGMDVDDWEQADPDAAAEALANPEPLSGTRVFFRVNYTTKNNK